MFQNYRLAEGQNKKSLKYIFAGKTWKVNFTLLTSLTLIRVGVSCLKWRNCLIGNTENYCLKEAQNEMEIKVSLTSHNGSH